MAAPESGRSRLTAVQLGQLNEHRSVEREAADWSRSFDNTQVLYKIGEKPFFVVEYGNS